MTIGFPGTGLSYQPQPRIIVGALRPRHGSILGGLVGLFLLYLLFRVLAGV